MAAAMTDMNYMAAAMTDMYYMAAAMYMAATMHLLWCQMHGPQPALQASHRQMANTDR